ncbi:MAG TPA: FG-GAP-like repeat-containing protein [Verrucomicrobiae bacterium]|nr:FG-GAP-like repeat-containing protein [Verrucomicrobiae bacterium]
MVHSSTKGMLRSSSLRCLPVFAAAILLAGLAILGSPSRAQEKSSGQLTLQVIVVDSPDKARQILDRLRNGEDFAAVARKESIDPSATEGGYLGLIDLSTLRPELRDALKGIELGRMTGVIAVPSGYVILKVLSPSQPAGGQGMGPGQNRDSPLAGKGAIRYPADVAGQVIADMLFQKFPKPANWGQVLPAICNIRKQSLAQGIVRLEELFTPENHARLEAMTAFDAIQSHYALAQLQAYQGNMDKAIEQWEAAYKIALSDLPAGVPQLTNVLGVAYLHKSEMENDIYRHPGERCLFPPRNAEPYRITADSEKAIQFFLKYLAQKPERPDHLQVKWLLNLAYMTLGKYPSHVPPEYLIPPSALESKQSIGRFVDVAPAAGLDFVSMANGVIVDDFGNRGLVDVVTSSYDVCSPMHYFRNNGNGTFADRASEAGLAEQLGGLNMVQADYNNDGCTDILVLRGAWEFPVRKSLLRNNCDGTFTDVTKEAGLSEPATRTQTAVWADIDNDGYLDLFVGNENGPSQLFLNKRDGTFEDISHSAGVDKIAFTKGVVAADYDNDGYVDFYVSNLYGGNFLYHNNRDRTFTEVSERAGVHQPQSQSFATWFFDYDNDGWPDIFVTSYFFSVDEALRSYLGLPHNAETFKLYKNMKDGTFKDVTAEVGLDKINVPMGANFGDVDNDGFLDIFLATGGPEYGALIPKMLLRNDEGKSFVDITASSGTGDLHKGHGVAFADLNNSGSEDILVSMGGATPGDAHPFRVFKNPGNKNNWLSVKLVGVKTNRSAIGARIKVTVENEGRAARSIYRTVGSGGSFGASPLQQHIGLGESAKITDLEVWWPASNTRQNFSGVGVNQFIEVKEFAKTYTKLARKPFSLDGAKADQVAAKSANSGNE